MGGQAARLQDVAEAVELGARVVVRGLAAVGVARTRRRHSRLIAISRKYSIRKSTELGFQSQINQIVVINLTIVIHILVTFFFLFHSQVIFKSFLKKCYFLIDYISIFLNLDLTNLNDLTNCF